MLPPFEELERELRAAGYRPGPPPAEVTAADAGVCARIACPRCRRVGLEYRPYVRWTDRGPHGVTDYRALAVCPDCGGAEEF